MSTRASATDATATVPIQNERRKAVTLSPAKLLQGETVMVMVRKNASPLVSAMFDKKPIAVFKYKDADRALIGIPVGKAPGKYPLVLTFKNGTKITRTLTVAKKKFRTIKIGIPDKVGVTPSELSAQLAKEKQNLDATLALHTQDLLFVKPFLMPLDATHKAGPFGDVRVTGGTIWRHLGVDFGAERGTPVAAINDGVARKVYTDTIYGNIVVVDHGEGIFSMYLHLDEFKVAEGDAVARGQAVGTVGDTGYSTAPHLHLTVKVNGISIDPAQFMSVFQ